MTWRLQRGRLKLFVGWPQMLRVPGMALVLGKGALELPLNNEKKKHKEPFAGEGSCPNCPCRKHHLECCRFPKDG